MLWWLPLPSRSSLLGPLCVSIVCKVWTEWLLLIDLKYRRSVSDLLLWYEFCLYLNFSILSWMEQKEMKLCVINSQHCLYLNSSILSWMEQKEMRLCVSTTNLFYVMGYNLWQLPCDCIDIIIMLFYYSKSGIVQGYVSCISLSIAIDTMTEKPLAHWIKSKFH